MWKVVCDGETIAYYYRNPLLFTEYHEVQVTQRGAELGFNDAVTGDPLMEYMRQDYQMSEAA